MILAKVTRQDQRKDAVVVARRLTEQGKAKDIKSERLDIKHIDQGR